ncbi:protein phosphatase CheZ [Ramlibacter sp. RBP-2]|uniref:Protein phosphatase CheZ n=1 Tax=Ramlibacter lithotrophicus TaxID=2606681 RepID=A0A7X6DFB7_9BURK|nr:protein phosphatase CheZ [Ramlibacter lithotrophicus]NKE66134.1 protein phosphatase CheZ [Ramlibacter lithotrophicus]
MSDEQTQTEAADAASILTRVGQLTRQLRDGLRELGLDRHVALAAEAIPDARERLAYVASMTERAADRVLNAVDVAQPLQERLAADAKGLGARWSQWFADPHQLDTAHALVADTRAYLAQVPPTAAAINGQLLEITMAQDFQDLTGQVIKKLMDVISEVETELLRVLVDHAPKGSLPQAEASLQNGPQIKPGHSSGVSSQAEADALLESLGF